MLVIMTAAHLTKVIVECAASVKKLLRPDPVVMESYILNFYQAEKKNCYSLKTHKITPYPLDMSSYMLVYSLKLTK